jgi:hypothetical protein
MFKPEHCSARASELEALAAHCTDHNIRASYLELAHGFREMANMASRYDDEALRLAERIIGKTSSHH